MNYIITVGIAIILAILETAALMPFAGDAPPIGALLFGTFCGGLYVGHLAANALKYKPKPRLPRVPIDAKPTRPLIERLQAFTLGDDCTNADKRAPETSRMPFWTLGTEHDLTPPKTSSSIRHILYRIRSILTSRNG